MYRLILNFLLKWIEKIYVNSENALVNLRKQIYFLDYEDRESDVFVISYMKSGTTWMQVILYNLLTDGNMDFNHIYDVSPWPKNQAANNVSVEKINSLKSPRILKSHDSYNSFNTDVKFKFVYVYRDGKDVSLSLYYHNKHYVDPQITYDENFNEFFTIEEAQMNWFKFNKEWLENKNNFNILYISYESLKTDFENCINIIANFVGVQLNETIIERVKKHSSFQYMKQHETKFGEIPPLSTQLIYNQFIRNGKTGEGNKFMNEKQLEFYEKKYLQYIVPHFSKIK